ncbi:LysR family transcriptional regulator [Sphingomonas sp. SUN039]|uniref:LysR family transcriptional regulator n=1 Tax=Sphingomonas sp. SUN039 TaxID=2937787 RepID=UPI0021646143|nr:LysR family transcriptional regulator [Sphingomonas sp. SUN039]UVO54352.1 LysR family transcriptional regulator [Sphingomonas sp. SUN039]
MRFKGLDLNLLVALDVLLETRNVSRAAERLYLSQPAVSAALARLRQFFNDPILIADGKRMIPSAHALRLQPMLKTLLAGADTMIASSPTFEPADSRRLFRIGASDFITTVAFAPLLRRLATEAPGVQLDITPPSDTLAQMLHAGELDAIVVPAEHLSMEHPSEHLFSERHVVVGWRDNPVFARELTIEDFADAGHVAVEIGRLFRASFAEHQLRQAGVMRRIEVTVASFTVVPDLLVGTSRLAVMHERLARHASAAHPLAFAPLPFDFPMMEERIQFHRTRTDDPGIRWLIGALRDAVGDTANG